MPALFLSEQWCRDMTDAMAGHDGFQNAISNLDLTLQFEVTNVPDRGDVTYYLEIADGGASLEPGALDDPNVTVSNDYATAEAISKGDLNTQVAFMTGKLKVKGDMAKLMMNQSALNQFAAAASTVEVEYP